MGKKIIFYISFVPLLAAGSYFFSRQKNEPIAVGILYSQTGPLASIEVPITNAVLLAIEEINKQGGLLGRALKPVIFDAKSDLNTFREGAEKLITQEKVAVIFGCFTSASRKTVKPVIEKYKHILVYPTQYEGLEESQDIIYMGAVPNQQILPGVMWSFKNLGQRFFLVGSDYIYPHMAHILIREHITSIGGSIVGEEFVKLSSTHLEHVIKKIQETKPTVIINNLVGKENNEAFFNGLQKAGINSAVMPVMSFVLNETDLQYLSVSLNGNYCTWNYMQTIPSQENYRFVQNYKNKFGSQNVVNDIMEAEYVGVYLWSFAVRKVGTINHELIKKTIKEESWNAPEGVISIDRKNNHSWKIVRIGKVGNDKQFIIVWNSEEPIEPIPFPVYKDKKAWEKIMQAFYKKWGNKWQNE